MIHCTIHIFSYSHQDSSPNRGAWQEVQSCGRADISAPASQWFLLNQMRVRSSNFYVPALLLRAGSTLNSFEDSQTLSSDGLQCCHNAVMCNWGARYCQDRFVVLGEDSLQSSLGYGFWSTLSFLQLVFPLLPISRKRPLSHIFLVSYHAIVSCHFLYRGTTCHNHISRFSAENKNTGTRIGKYPLSLRARTTTKKIQLFPLLLW